MKTFSLSLDNETFNGFKVDFLQLLNATLSTMQEKGVDQASITAKFDITLTKTGNPNLNAPDAESEREYIAPLFKHKIVAAMKLQSEKTGTLGGKDYELLWDRYAGTFVMVPLNGYQPSMFDEEYGGDYEYDEETSDEETT